MNPLLLILNPRRIEQAITALGKLEIEKAWLVGYTEAQLVSVIRDLVETTDHSHYVVISDDAPAEQRALNAVLGLLPYHPVVTGWCPLDECSEHVNLTRSPLKSEVPCPQAYDLYLRDEVLAWPDAVVPTYFAGMCLTAMSRELWQRFPFEVFHGSPGCCSDYSLSLRLQQAGVPIVAARDAFVPHLKLTWNEPDPRHPVLVGQVEKEVVFE